MKERDGHGAARNEGRAHFRWQRLPATLLLRLQKDLHLGADPATDLLRRYGTEPSLPFVQDTWPALRDAWLRFDGECRHRIVTELVSAGEGEAASMGTPDGDLAFLATLRDARKLHRVVLSELRDLGRRDGADAGEVAAVTAAWQRFARALADTLRVLEPRQHLRLGAGELVLEFRCDDDGAVQVDGGAGADTLDAPGGGGADSLAAVAMAMARDAGVSHPGELTYEAGTDDGETVLLPLLGVPRAVEAASPLHVPPPGPGSERLRAQVEETIAAAFELDEVHYDTDGDIPLRYGSAMVFVRLVEESPIVRVFAPMLWEVPESSELLRAVNEINLQVAFARVAWDGHQVSVRTEFLAAPFEPMQLMAACQTVGEIADHFDDRLQGRFGGRIFFGKFVPVKDPGYEYGGYL